VLDETAWLGTFCFVNLRWEQSRIGNRRGELTKGKGGEGIVRTKVGQRKANQKVKKGHVAEIRKSLVESK